MRGPPTQGPKHGIKHAAAPIGNKVQGFKGGGQGVHDKEKGRETSATDENHKKSDDGNRAVYY